jgi:hypothetical protein
VGVLRSVVQILRLSVFDRAKNRAVRGAVAGELVGDQDTGYICQTLEQPTEEPLGRRGVAPGLDQDVQHIAVLVNRPPQVADLSPDGDEHLVEVPLISRTGPATAQLVGIGLAELATPLPDRLVGHHNPAFQHHLLDLTEAEREPVIQPDTVADDLRRKAESPVRQRTDGHQPSPPHPDQPVDRSSTPTATPS